MYEQIALLGADPRFVGFLRFDTDRNIATTLLNLVEFTQRFFPPHEIPAMLKTFLPRMSSSINSILATQAFCVHFLPLTHPQYYLPAIFKLWESFQSEIWDSQWLDFVDRLSVRHLDPNQSDPDLVEEIRIMAATQYSSPDVVDVNSTMMNDSEDVRMEDGTTRAWTGIRKNVGIFTEEQWGFIMTKCLRSMGKLRLLAPAAGRNALLKKNVC